MKIIERTKYLERIADVRKTHRIILLTGLHGSGKTDVLDAASRMLKEEKPPLRILHISPDENVTSGQELLSAAKALGARNSALFLDNADFIADLPEALSEILANYATTIFITGRNANILETVLSPIFGQTGTRELAIIRIGALSYTDFLYAWDIPESRESLDLYCRTGGLPQSMMIDPRSPDARTFSFIRADAFILTELVEPAAIRNPGHLRKLLALAARSIGETLPARQVCAAFAAERITISPQAALDYLSLCAGSGILIPVPVLDLDKKKILDSANIWYFGDTGLRSAFIQRETPANLARAKENLAFLRLVDDGWTVFHGRVGYGKQLKEDVSFVCERNGKRVYVQIINSVATSGERLRKREALLAIHDVWPRYLVDPDPNEEDKDGIIMLDIRELLVSGIQC